MGIVINAEALGGLCIPPNAATLNKGNCIAALSSELAQDWHIRLWTCENTQAPTEASDLESVHGCTICQGSWKETKHIQPYPVRHLDTEQPLQGSARVVRRAAHRCAGWTKAVYAADCILESNDMDILALTMKILYPRTLKHDDDGARVRSVPAPPMVLAH